MTNTTQDIRLMKGMYRAAEAVGGVPTPNDQGMVFATTDADTAERYSAGHVLEFVLSGSATVANLNNPETVREIAQRIVDYDCGAWTGEDLNDEDTFEAFVAELSQGGYDCGNTIGDLGIMDDLGFAQAVGECGYDVATQDGHYCILDADLLSAVQDA